MSRQNIVTLKAGWSPYPIKSEIILLMQLLELDKQYPAIALKLMNFVTAESAQILKDTSPWTIVTLFWWHLVNDNLNFFQIDISWSATQSLESPRDRASLKNLKDNVFTAISIHSTPTDDSETNCQLIKEKRENSYNLALPLLLDQ